MSSLQHLNKQLRLTTVIITLVLMAGLLLPNNFSHFFIDEVSAGIGGPVPRHGTVMTRGVERTAAGNPIWAEIGTDGKIVADINEAAGQYKDAKAISVLSYLSIVAAYNSFKSEHADGIAKGATVLTRDVYAQKNFPDVTVTLASTTQGVVNTKVVSITKYNLRDNTQSVLIRHENTVIDPDLLPTKGPQRGMILYEAPIDLRKSEIKTEFDPSIKTLLLSSTGSILKKSPHNIGYKTSFYKTDGSGEALGPVVGAHIDAGIYSLNYSTLSGNDGKYNLTIFIPPCPGFSFVHDYNIWAKVFYTNFDPEAPSALGFYYYKSPDIYHCNNLSALFSGSPSLAGQMTGLALRANETDNSSILAEHNFYIDMLKFTGVGFLSNGTNPLPFGETKYTYEPSTLDKIKPENLDLNLDRIADVAENVSGTNYYDVYLDGQTTNADGSAKDADLQRLADVAPDFTDQGLLKSISIKDMMKTDIYIYRVSNGKIVVKKKGLRERAIIKNGSGFAFNLTLPGPLDDLSDGLFTTSAQISQFQAAIGFPPEMIGRKADFLRPGEEVKIIAINRPTGYIGSITTTVHTPIDGSYTVKIDNLVMRPPNLKVSVERIYSVVAGSTKGEKKEYKIGFEGSALTSDTLVSIYTEWFDHKGLPLPGKLEGYTGRLAKVTGVNSLVGGSVNTFSIKPGSKLQVLKFKGDILGTEHFYIHVSGYPEWSNPGIGAGDGPLAFRPKNYVPIKVPVLDEVKTRQLRDINTYKIVDGLNALDKVEAVYEWPYRPEMQFSVFDLTVNALKLKSSDNTTTNLLQTPTTINTTDQSLQIFYDLLANSNDPLLTFGPARELVFAIGGDEQLASSSTEKGKTDPLTFTSLAHLSDLSSEELLSIRLYQSGDMENILWEYNLLALEVISSSNPGSKDKKSFVIRTTEAPIRVQWLFELQPTDTVQWKVEALSGLKVPNVKDDLGNLTDAAKKKTMYGKIQMQSFHGEDAGGDGTGEYGTPWLSDSRLANTVLLQQQLKEVWFRPDMSDHPHPQWQTAEDDLSVHKGTKKIDVWHRNPRVGYKVTFYLNSKEMASTTVRMDRSDMIRQEYIDHLGMSYTNSNGNTYTRNIPVPERDTIKAIPATPVYFSGGVWSESEYGLMMEDQMFELGAAMNLAFVARKTFYSQAENTLKDINGTELTYPNVNMFLNSGYRNPERQERIGTAINSKHQLGNAVDFGFRGGDYTGDRERAALYQVIWEAANSVTLTFKQLEKGGATLSLGLDDNGNGLDDAFEFADHLHIH